MLVNCRALWSLFYFEHKDHCQLRYWLFYTILTLTLAKKQGGKGLLCLNISYVPVIASVIHNANKKITLVDCSWKQKSSDTGHCKIIY